MYNIKSQKRDLCAHARHDVAVQYCILSCVSDTSQPYSLVLLNAWHVCVLNRKQQLLLMSRWKYVGGSPNAARFSTVTIQGVLHLLALMRQGLQVYAGTPPLIIIPALVFTFGDAVVARRLQCHA